MGKCGSTNNKLNNSFPGNYILTDNEEITPDWNTDKPILFQTLIERLNENTILKTELKNDKITKETFKKKKKFIKRRN